MGANDRQVAGDHYKAGFQHWDWAYFLGLEYLPGQITKYVLRSRKKNGRQDLEKAMHFLEKLIEVDEQKTNKIRSLTDILYAENNVTSEEVEIIDKLIVYIQPRLEDLIEVKIALKNLLDK